MSRLLDPKKNGTFPFEYRNSANTDVRVTWERAKKEQAAAQLRKVVALKKGPR